MLAVSMTIRNRRQGKLPFALSWWAFVFPIGACSVLACILTDMIGCFLSKKEYGVKDLSTIAYGMALALMLPASVEYYVVIIGAVLAITTASRSRPSPRATARCASR